MAVRISLLTRRLLTIAAIVIASLVLAAAYRHYRPENLEHLGGEWHIKPVSVYWGGHSANWHDLYRKTGIVFVRVDSQLSNYRYYPPDQRRSYRSVESVCSRTGNCPIAAIGARTHPSA